jgi:hypothetical protein
VTASPEAAAHQKSRDAAAPARAHVTVVVPTFEPGYRQNDKLEDYYAANFDSWLDPHGEFDLKLVLSDFKSSDPFKEFLLRYATSREAVHFVDGHVRTLNSIAANVGFSLFPYDIAVWAASDTRARDRAWLGQLTEAFADPGVMAAYATSPIDASHLVDQLQPGPIDKPARRLVFPESPIPNVVAFKKSLLERFGDRMTDISAYNVSEGSAWQLEAVGGRAVVSYRCNVLHDHFFEGGRYLRQGDDNWMNGLRPNEAARFRAIHGFLSVPEGIRDPAGFRPVLRPLAEGFRTAGLRGLARALYIRLRQTQATYSLQAIRKKGFWPYIMQHRIARQQHEAFAHLPEQMRCDFVQSLFFADAAVYRELKYDVRT